jgi:hypothetical protein
MTPYRPKKNSRQSSRVFLHPEIFSLDSFGVRFDTSDVMASGVNPIQDTLSATNLKKENFKKSTNQPFKIKYYSCKLADILLMLS